MKKHQFIVSLLICFGLAFLFSSCDKQKSTYEVIGEIQYLDNTTFDECGNEVVAHFYFLPGDFGGMPYPSKADITGKVPTKFQSKERLKVWIKYKFVCSSFDDGYLHFPIYNTYEIVKIRLAD
jgi:hypothetical protein